jgi:hypothetical protein
MVLPRPQNRPFPPVPIIARGHFDDPRAQDCRPEARDLCRNRFVIEEVIDFEPRVLPPPSPVADPTPFLSPPPPPPLDADDCFVDESDVASSGWTSADEIGLRLAYTGHIYAIVTEPLAITDWLIDPTSGERYKVWSQWACYQEDYYIGTGVTAISGRPLGPSMYWEYEDGGRVDKPLP